MTPMGALVVGLVVFFAVHSIAIVDEPWRDRMAARIGEGPWKGMYSLVSLLGLVLIVWGFGLARQAPIVLYTPPAWLRHLTVLLMVPAFPLLLAAYLPGRIKAVTKHPMLAAVKLWAFAHLLANGMLADIVLFGSFLAWAAVDRISMKRRVQRPVPGLPPSKLNDLIAIAGGLALYVAFVLWLHRWLFGVSPIGRAM
jgi:uncharacterized membrane protein